MASNFETQGTNCFRAHHCHHTAHNIYPIHTKLWKPYWHIKVLTLLLKYQYRQNGWWWRQFGSSQESEIDPPFVLDSIWDCPGITLNIIVDDDGKTILGWHCGYCLILGNRGGSRFFRHRNASKALSHLTKGKDIVTCTGLRHIPAKLQMLSMP